MGQALLRGARYTSSEPPSHLSDCCRPSLFVFCKHLAHNRPVRSVGVAGFVRKGGTNMFNGLAEKISSGTLGEVFIANKRGIESFC